MNTTIKLLAATVIATAAWGATQSFAGAGDDCKSYAQASAKQQQENEARSCKFKTIKDDHWTTDVKKHLKWCKSVPPQKWKAAKKKRDNKLKACK